MGHTHTYVSGPPGCDPIKTRSYPGFDPKLIRWSTGVLGPDAANCIGAPELAGLTVWWGHMPGDTVAIHVMAHTRPWRPDDAPAEASWHRLAGCVTMPVDLAPVTAT